MAVRKFEEFLSPEVHVVEASAGSGKTYALAKRYIQLLLRPQTSPRNVSVRSILALTFTNKAAFEMKSRILSYLKAIALNKLSDYDFVNIIAPLGISNDEGKVKASEIMDYLIHNYNYFQVETIDKFINAILAGCAFRIGLTAKFKIKTRYEEYIAYSLDELIDEAKSDKKIKNIFSEFIHNYLYLENRSNWFPKEDILAIINGLFEQSNHYGVNFTLGNYKTKELIKDKSKVLEQIKKLYDSLKNEEGGKLEKSLSGFLENRKISFDIDNLSDYFNHEEMPAKEPTCEQKKLWKEIRESLSEISQREAFSLFNSYIDIFNLVFERFLEATSQKDILFLGELNKRARLLFNEANIPVAELYYRLASRFYHYLIDEFQDTSRLQWENLFAMIEEALSTGGTLFYVGDKKQAIYSFRGGEVELFDEIRNHLSHFNVSVEALSTNWRSQKAIVDFNNRLFSLSNINDFVNKKEAADIEKKKKNAVLINKKDIEEISKVFEFAQQSALGNKSGGYVKVDYIDIDKKEERDRVVKDKLLTLVRELTKRYLLKDIAILTRSNAEIEEITAWLLEQNILVQSERTSNIKENNLIAELISLLQFLVNPADNLSFTKFITGEIFTSASGLNQKELNMFVFNLRERMIKKELTSISVEFKKAYPKAWEMYFQSIVKQVGFCPSYELVVSIYERFKCLENFQDSQAFLMRFLELITKQEEENIDMEDFLNAFKNLEGEELFVHLTDINALQIMTIHKAKGLEFPVVIIPNLKMEIQVGFKGEDNKYSYVLHKKDGNIGLIKLKDRYRNFSAELDGIYSMEYKRSFAAELNNIYVALTRAKEELYITIPKKTGNSINLARYFIPPEIYELGKTDLDKRSQIEESNVLNLPVSKYSEWFNDISDEHITLNSISERDKLKEGEIMHFFLSQLPNLNGHDIDGALLKAKILTEKEFPQSENLVRYIEKMKTLVLKSNLRKFFDCDSAEVSNETEIVDLKGTTKRIDRLIISNDEVWVIDYKSTQSNEEDDIKQIKEYKDIIKGLYPKKKIRGFLIYIEKLKDKEID